MAAAAECWVVVCVLRSSRQMDSRARQDHTILQSYNHTVLRQSIVRRKVILLIQTPAGQTCDPRDQVKQC